ncbi:MAG: hypothetical protein OEW66_09310 [Actinomycetota bacterium]|nr:hypothetical protein [Actinomycetota bacterium]MDH5314016.1 hypothetical protein [Actinomycetota bacterium]
MTLAGVAEPPAASFTHDLLDATPIAVLRAIAAVLGVAALGQVPPALVNVAGGGLAVSTQLRVGWLYTMAGHAVSIAATGSGGSVEGIASGVVGVRLGLLTVAACAVAMLAIGARAVALRVEDVGARRVIAGSLIALPYAAVVGAVNAGIDLQLHTAGDLLPASTSIEASLAEGFAIPGAIALVAGLLGGWSVSSSWWDAPARAVRAGLRAFSWAIGLSFVAVLSFSALRPEGLERYSVEMWSQGPHRASLYLGHQILLLPNQAMWVFAPSMGGCVALRVDAAAHDLICLDRIPRGPDPASWLFSELGRVQGTPPTTAMPVAVWLFVAVPAAAVVLGFLSLAHGSRLARRALAEGLGGGMVFAALVTVTSLAASLWLTTRDGDLARTVSMGPDPVSTAVLALAWGAGGGALVSVSGPVWRRFSRRVRPR